MRIAIDVRATQTGHRNRGIGRSVLDLVEALSKYGGDHSYGLLLQKSLPTGFDRLPHNFEVVPVGGPLLGIDSTWLMNVPKLRKWPPVQVLNSQLILAQHRREFLRSLNDFKPDVFHEPVPIDHFTDTCVPLDVRRVVTFHDAIPRLDPKNHYDPMLPHARVQYDRQLSWVGKADRIVAISKSSQDEVITFSRAKPEQVVVVYHAIPEDFALESKESIEAYTGGQPYFLFLSALAPHKNPLNVLRAYACIGSSHRMVFLSSKGEMYDELMALANELDVQDRVTVTGVMTDEGVRALVQGATALVSPSFYEGFGLPAAQAMRAGVPAIVSDRKSQPEVVGEAGITVNPEDVDEIASAMRRMANDVAYRQELSERGRERAGLFSLERLAKNMVDVYEGREPSSPIPSP